MRPAAFTKIEWIVIGALLAGLVALLTPSTQCVWDGDFRLTVRLHEREPIDRESLQFATYWLEPEAQHALQNPGACGSDFRRPEFSAHGYAMIASRPREPQIPAAQAEFTRDCDYRLRRHQSRRSRLTPRRPRSCEESWLASCFSFLSRPGARTPLPSRPVQPKPPSRPSIF